LPKERWNDVNPDSDQKLGKFAKISCRRNGHISGFIWPAEIEPRGYKPPK
jgi:hypothetical protein